MRQEKKKNPAPNGPDQPPPSHFFQTKTQSFQNRGTKNSITPAPSPKNEGKEINWAASTPEQDWPEKNSAIKASRNEAIYMQALLSSHTLNKISGLLKMLLNSHDNDNIPSMIEIICTLSRYCDLVLERSKNQNECGFYRACWGFSLLRNQMEPANSAIQARQLAQRAKQIMGLEEFSQCWLKFN